MSKASTPDVVALDVTLVDPGDNDRTTFADGPLRELADSIAETGGVLQPITVRPVGGRFEIVAGERRYRAVAHVLGWPTIDSIVRTLDDEAASRAMLAENVQRVDLDPLAEAEAYQRRMDRFGLTAAEVAEWARVSPARVASRLPILRLGPEGRELVRCGALSVNHAKVLAALDGNRQVVALRALTDHELSYFEFRDLCARLEGEQAQESFAVDDFWTVETIADVRAGRARPNLRKLLGLLADALEHTGSAPDLVDAARTALAPQGVAA